MHPTVVYIKNDKSSVIKTTSHCEPVRCVANSKNASCCVKTLVYGVSATLHKGDHQVVILIYHISILLSHSSVIVKHKNMTNLESTIG